MLTAVKQACQTYYDELPKRIGPTIAKSALYTFAISLFFMNHKEPLNLAPALTNAGVAALASTIHAVMTPFFNRVFGKQNSNIYHEVTKSITTAFLASAAVAAIMSSRVNFLSFKLFNLISCNSAMTWMNSSSSKPYIKENSIYLCF